MKKDRRPQDRESPIEALRIERTNLSQAEFAVHCGVPLRTYQRWVSGETEAKLTPQQWKALMELLKLQVNEIPNNFGSIEQKFEKRED
jgi:DNA-binding transcriptional regulator YiaG